MASAYLIAAISSVKSTFPVCEVAFDCGVKYPMMPTFVPSTFITIEDFKELFCKLESFETFRLAAKIGKLTFLRNCARFSVPSSNSWLPRHFMIRNNFAKRTMKTLDSFSPSHQA